MLIKSQKQHKHSDDERCQEIYRNIDVYESHNNQLRTTIGTKARYATKVVQRCSEGCLHAMYVLADRTLAVTLDNYALLHKKTYPDIHCNSMDS
jgi:hypothetical protein